MQCSFSQPFHAEKYVTLSKESDSFFFNLFQETNNMDLLSGEDLKTNSDLWNLSFALNRQQIQFFLIRETHEIKTKIAKIAGTKGNIK